MKEGTFEREEVGEVGVGGAVAVFVSEGFGVSSDVIVAFALSSSAVERFLVVMMAAALVLLFCEVLVEDGGVGGE
jgi:hypothetical protein